MAEDLMRLKRLYELLANDVYPCNPVEAMLTLDEISEAWRRLMFRDEAVCAEEICSEHVMGFVTEWLWILDEECRHVDLGIEEDD